MIQFLKDIASQKIMRISLISKTILIKLKINLQGAEILLFGVDVIENAINSDKTR